MRNNQASASSTRSRPVSPRPAAGKLFYLVANIYPHNAKTAHLEDDMAPVIAMQPDALIMADPG